MSSITIQSVRIARFSVGGEREVELEARRLEQAR
jgi:hypothetical protein